MLDHLEFEDDDVFNLVIDRAKPEGILVTNDLRYFFKYFPLILFYIYIIFGFNFRVQELFQNENRVPRNTNFAITDSWYVIIRLF